MIRLLLVENEDTSNSLQQRFYGVNMDGTNVALEVEGEILGLLTYSITDVVTIKAVCVSEKIRGKGLGDFLIRATMNNLTATRMDIVIDYEDTMNYYAKFGFCKDKNSKMRVNSQDIVFPSKCNKH